MKQLITILSLLLFLNSFSQTKYESAYIITNNGEKIEGLILNEDWRVNPREINFKSSQDEPAQTMGIGSVEEFGINGEVKYQRATVRIDKSSELLKTLTDERSLDFQEEQLFLKVLIDGKASLYSFEGVDFKKFFYRVGDSDIEQLVFKTYLTTGTRIGENNQYKQQLLNSLQCADISSREIEHLKYTSEELIRVFKKYNKCEGGQFSDFTERHEKSNFDLSLKAGIRNSSLEIMNSMAGARDTDFESQIGFQLGLEAELVLPFHNNKWSIVVEPTYQTFHSKKETESLESEVNYNSIELPFGIRHSVFLNESSKLFLNGYVIVDLNFNSEFNFKSEALSTLEVKSGSNLAFGVGYEYGDRFSVEFRYYTTRDLLNNYGGWNSEYNTAALIFGYKLF